MDPIVPDFRKTLPLLHQQWSGCTRCELGVRRLEVNGNFVAGEGVTGGLMFVGEGPGKEEEAHGRPFVGASGRILRSAIEALRLDACYLTNAVACRSCEQALDREGQPKYFRVGGVLQPRIQDRPPTPAQVAACKPRLVEEIYLVDPIVIVALGAAAAEALTGKSVGIQAANGSPVQIKIPGAGRVASITEKKKVWARKVHGRLILPTTQNFVSYLMVPVVHPAFVARRWVDRREGNAVQMFVNGLQTAARIYDRYMFEVYGVSDPPPRTNLTQNTLINVLEDL